jgi:hypothetical protein
MFAGFSAIAQIHFVPPASIPPNSFAIAESFDYLQSDNISIGNKVLIIIYCQCDPVKRSPARVALRGGGKERL